MWNLKNKKKEMTAITNQTLSKGMIFVKKQMPEVESGLKYSIPQARLIKQNDSTMNFDVEYTPDNSSFWFGGKYTFSFQFSDEYPDTPPKVLCKTKIYHPNIDYNGNVCLNILKKDWVPTLTLIDCILGVYQLFIEPNPNDPLNHDAAKVMRDNIEQFKENVKRTLKGGYCFGQDFPRFTRY